MFVTQFVSWTVSIRYCDYLSVGSNPTSHPFLLLGSRVGSRQQTVNLSGSFPIGGSSPPLAAYAAMHKAKELRQSWDIVCDEHAVTGGQSLPSEACKPVLFITRVWCNLGAHELWEFGARFKSGTLDLGFKCDRNEQ